MIEFKSNLLIVKINKTAFRSRVNMSVDMSNSIEQERLIHYRLS
jgi:hypothetical protein